MASMLARNESRPFAAAAKMLSLSVLLTARASMQSPEAGAADASQVWLPPLPVIREAKRSASMAKPGLRYTSNTLD